jgi:hippurate hydrolase
MPIRNRFAARLADHAAWRRDFHAHPELGFEETRTARIVADRLRSAGWSVTEGIGGTGVVGSLQRGRGRRAIGLRADMDALAMTERVGPEVRAWTSTIPGRMHACGHDGHTAMLLGAADRLARAGRFDGTVHAIFQPAEEGRGGAAAMLADGLLERFPMARIFGLHNMPGLAPDEMAVVHGPQLACSDRWIAVFEGIGTHGAKPHLGRDPFPAASHFLAALQTIPGREVDPLEPAVVSACAISGGDFEALNVIPDRLRIGGTARAFSADVRDRIEAVLARLADATAQAHGCTARLEYRRGMPPVVNEAGATESAASAAISVLGAERVRRSFPPSMAGDDFAEFSTRVPGAYVWLGNGPARDGALHHNTAYDFCDAAIPAGVAFWVALVEQELPA